MSKPSLAGAWDDLVEIMLMPAGWPEAAIHAFRGSFCHGAYDLARMVQLGIPLAEFDTYRGRRGFTQMRRRFLDAIILPMRIPAWNAAAHKSAYTGGGVAAFTLAWHDGVPVAEIVTDAKAMQRAAMRRLATEGKLVPPGRPPGRGYVPLRWRD